MSHAMEDVPVTLIKQLGRWLDAGSMVDRTGLLDYSEALPSAAVPLLAVAAQGDRVSPVRCVVPSVSRWGHHDRALMELPESYGHYDALVSPDADTAVFTPVVDWLVERRRLAWEREGDLGQSASRSADAVEIGAEHVAERHR
jgi:hypothetical protein